MFPFINLERSAKERVPKGGAIDDFALMALEKERVPKSGAIDDFAFIALEKERVPKSGAIDDMITLVLQLDAPPQDDDQCDYTPENYWCTR